MIFKTTYALYIITIILLIGLLTMLQYGNLNNLIYSNNFKNTIIAYYGDTPPDGWILCDGRIVNGRQTPDLRSKFVLGGSENSQNILQGYQKNIDTSNLDINSFIDIYNASEFNNYITDSTSEIQGGKNFTNKTSRIFNKEIIKNNLQTLTKFPIDDESRDNIESLSNQVTSSFNEIIDKSFDINNSHVFNSKTETNEENITSFINIESIVDITKDIMSISDTTTTNTLPDVNNEEKYKQITGVTTDTTTQTPISEQQYKTWLNTELGNNEFTDSEYDLLWTEFENNEYDDDYVDNFSITKFIQELNNSSINEDTKNVIILKLYLAYNPTIHTKITNKENVYTEYDHYKYPSSKQLTADNNLPPYYSLIYIMKL